ncbi:hypothetical protein GCM10028775_18360 [Catellatospora paridis]
MRCNSSGNRTIETYGGLSGGFGRCPNGINMAMMARPVTNMPFEMTVARRCSEGLTVAVNSRTVVVTAEVP